VASSPCAELDMRKKESDLKHLLEAGGQFSDREGNPTLEGTKIYSRRLGGGRGPTEEILGCAGKNKMETLAGVAKGEVWGGSGEKSLCHSKKQKHRGAKGKTSARKKVDHTPWKGKKGEEGREKASQQKNGTRIKKSLETRKKRKAPSKKKRSFQTQRKKGGAEKAVNAQKATSIALRKLEGGTAKRTLARAESGKKAARRGKSCYDEKGGRAKIHDAKKEVRENASRNT